MSGKFKGLKFLCLTVFIFAMASVGSSAMKSTLNILKPTMDSHGNVKYDENLKKVL